MSNPSTDVSQYHIPIDLIPLNVAVYRYIGTDFIFVDFNKHAEQTEKIHKEDLIGKNLCEIFTAAKEFGIYERLLRVYEQGGHETFENALYQDERISGWRKNEIIRLPNGDVMAIYEDLTQTKELEEENLHHKKHLQLLGSIIDTNMNEVFVFDADTLRFTYVNQAAQTNIGYTFDEMMFMTPIDIKPEYTMETFVRMIEPLRTGALSDFTFETLHRRKNGSDYLVEIRLQLMEVENKKQFVVIAHDITERKQVQLQLEESEAKFRSIAENALMGIFIYRDNYIYVNDAFASMVGYTKEELYRMPIWNIIEDSYREKVKEAAKRRLIGEDFPLTYSDIKLVSKTGRIKTVRVSTRTIKYKGQFAGMGTLIDISDITEVKGQLKMLAQAIEQTDDLVKIVNTKGYIVFVNDSIISHSGYTRSELIGAHTRIFKSGHHNQEFYAHLWATVSAGNTFRDIFINRKKDGTLLYEEETITPILDENGGVDYYVSTGKDVSKRIELESALRESEINFRNIFNKSSDGIVIHDPEGNLVEVNSVLSERLGYSRDELIGKNLSFIDSPKAYKNLPEATKNLQEYGHVLLESEHVRKDGGVVPVEVHATLIDYMNKPAVLSVVRDISERKSSEQALQEAEELYHTMFDISPVGIVIINPETGKAVEFNRISHEKLGYSAEEFSRLQIGDYEVHESDEETAAHMEALKNGKAEVFETQHRTKNGEILDVIVSVQLIEVKGKPHLFSIFHDVTSMKEYEKVLKMLSLRLTVATKAASIGVWEWNVKTDTLIWDDQMYAIYGIEKCSAEEPYATWRNAVDPEDIGSAEASLQSAIRGEGEYNVQFWITTPKNERRFVQAMGTVERDESGDVTRIVGVNWDMTRQKEYEKALEIAKQSAESANAAKSNFLANMSHEIRTPMNAILGMIQLTHTLDLPQEAEEYLKKIEKSSKLLLHIINDILDFSKIEANRLEITPISFDLNEIIEQISALFGPKADAKGLELLLRITPQIPTRLIGDSMRLSQILNNLLSNAVKFTRSGVIEVSISIEKRSEEKITLEFSVKDTGIGIASKDHYKIFSMFSQADESITRKYGGTGLGLSISKRLVELMGGELEFLSEEGVGSTFYFSAEFGIDKANTADIADFSMQNGLDVLVVDDQESAREIIKEIFTSWDCRVDESENGEDALKKIKSRVEEERPYDLILVDWSMPGLNGVETIQAIREIEKERQGQDIHIIMMVTAYSKDIVLKSIQDENIIDVFLNKPVTYSSVYDAISNKGLHNKLRTSSLTQKEDLVSIGRQIRGASVLLVEDNEINIQVESAFLRQMGLEVTVVTDGLQAVQLLEKEHFDAILMDYQMPVMDGIEATEVIRRRGDTTPIIAMTAAAMQSDKEACFRAGMNDYLSKPIDILLMGETLIKWIPPRIYEEEPLFEERSIRQSAVLPESIEGIDMKEGLSNSADSKELYHRILLQFVHQYDQGCLPLETMLEKGEANEAQRWVHTLKGISATIGAKELYSRALAVEGKLREKQSAVLDELCYELGRICEALELLNERDILWQTQFNYPIAIRQLNLIGSKLEKSQLVEPEEIQMLEEALGQYVRLSSWSMLNDTLENFDYERAQDAIKALQTVIEDEHESANR